MFLGSGSFSPHLRFFPPNERRVGRGDRPAMEAGLSDHIWCIEELCALLPKPVSATARIDKGIILQALDGNKDLQDVNARA